MLTQGRLMTLRKALWWIGGSTFCLAGLYASEHSAFSSERPFRVYPSMEAYDDIPLPTDYRVRQEWVFARLMYPQHPSSRFGRFSRRRGGRADWREGGTSWTQDYPRADRHLAELLRRLTRLQPRSVEEPVNLDDNDDVYNYPWLCAGEMGDWKLTDDQVVKLRDYLLRGGFLMLDDFWGTEEWNRFNESMNKVFPDRDIVEIEDTDPIFHVAYDLDERYQVPGEWALGRGSTYRNDGAVPHWRGIYDDNGRLMVAMTFNSDVGDSWEWADDPRYPEKYSALGIRIAVNYVLYSLSH
jgi:uncharacterized protein DUF4159